MTAVNCGAQMWLYHALRNTGTIEVSTDNATWVDATLSSPQPLEDALAEFAGAATTVLPARTFSMAMASGIVTLSATGGTTYYRMHATLAAIFGFASETGALPISTTLTPTGYVAPGDAVPIGRTMVRDVESAELNEFSHGRVTSKQWGRHREVELEFCCPHEDATELVEGSLLSGHGLMRVRLQDTSSAYSATAFTGYLDVYPFDPLSVETVEGSEDEVVVTLTATVADDDLGAEFLERFITVPA